MNLENKDNTFSYSRINTFDHCPQKYKIQYIDLIDTLDDSIEAFMGKRVHEVLENLFNIKDLNNKYIPFDKLIDMYNRSWLENWHDNIFISKFKYDRHSYNKDTVYRNGLECLKNFYNRFNNSGYFKENILSVEYPFKVNIGKYNFRGYIDRVDRNSDDVIDIFDYKTSAKSKTKSKAIKDLQLGIYEIAIKKIFKNCKEINLHLYYLKNDTLISFKHSDIEIKKIEQKIIDRIDTIQSTNIYMPKEGILCEWCYFWNHCDVKATNNPSIRAL